MTHSLADSQLGGPSVSRWGPSPLTLLHHQPIIIPKYRTGVKYAGQSQPDDLPAMTPHPTLTYKGDDDPYVLWTPAGFPMPYVFAKCNRQHCHYFKEEPSISEMVDPVWPSLKPYLLPDPHDPYLQGNDHPLKIEFIEYQACPVLGCPQGANLDRPVTEQPSTFRYLQMAQHFYNNHMSAAHRTFCRLCGYTAIKRYDFERHLANLHDVHLRTADAPPNTPMPAKYVFVAHVIFPAGTYTPARGIQISFRDYYSSVVPESPSYPHWRNYKFATRAPPGVTPPQVWWDLATNSYISPQGTVEPHKLRRRAQRYGYALDSPPCVPDAEYRGLHMRPAGSESDPQYDQRRPKSPLLVIRLGRGHARIRTPPGDTPLMTSARTLTIQDEGRDEPFCTQPKSTTVPSGTDSDATDKYDQFEDVRETITATSPLPTPLPDSMDTSQHDLPMDIVDDVPTHDTYSDTEEHDSMSEDGSERPSTASTASTVLIHQTLNSFSREQLFTIPSELSYDDDNPMALPQEFASLYSTLHKEIQNAMLGPQYRPCMLVSVLFRLIIVHASLCRAGGAPGLHLSDSLNSTLSC